MSREILETKNRQGLNLIERALLSSGSMCWQILILRKIRS